MSAVPGLPLSATVSAPVSLQARLTFLSTIAFLGFAVVSALILSWTVRDRFEQIARERGTVLGRMLNYAFETMIERKDMAALQRMVDNAGSEADVERIVVVDRDLAILAGKVTGADRGREQRRIGPGERERVAMAIQGRSTAVDEVDADGHTVMTIVLPLRGGRYFPEYRSDVVGAILVSYDLAGFQRAARTFVATALLTQCASFLIVMALLYVFVRQSVLKPIAALVSVAQGLKRGDLSARARVAERTEMGRLGEALNDMAEALQRLLGTLETRSDELARSNRELEAFCYSVSHDLRAPLRSIHGFSQAIEEDCAEGLDAAGREHLGRIRAAARRMGRLIDDLLDLSRLTRVEMRRQAIDLTSLAREAERELRESDPSRCVAIEIEDGLVTDGDPALLRVALGNLLRNAWKFTRTRASARIVVGAESLDGRPAFFVRDNGVGFDVAHADKLFGAFQRLHTEVEFPGNGIGLATVQRIVQRHGGRIWAQAEPDRGATFYFTLS